MRIIAHIITVFFLFLSLSLRGQNPGDYGAITSGSWTTVSIWRQWNGSAWATVPGSFPNLISDNVYILSGSIVEVPTGGPYKVSALRVLTGGKLYANNIAQVYISVYGNNIVCDGEIGNTSTFDGLSFNIEGNSCTVSGTGTFTASRIRKSTTTISTTTTLIISMNVTLRWSSSSATAIYNNVPTGTSRFDVTVNIGCTLNVAGDPPTYPANLSVDGIDGLGTAEAAGQYTINGTLIVSGIVYATTNNITNGFNAAFLVSSTGVFKANQINSPNSGTAGMTFNVQSGGKLELTGTNGFYVTGGVTTWGTTSNRYAFLAGSTVEYSSTSNQNVLTQTDFSTSTAPNNQYWNLTTSGLGNKILRGPTVPFVVRGNVKITGASVFDQATNSPDIIVGGNWSNYNQTGFNQSTNTLKSVKFYGSGTTPNTITQTISCPGGEVFTNLWIAKQTGANFSTVKLLSPVTVTNQLTLGQGNTSYYGVLDLNKNSLTLDNPATSAITLIGIGQYNRFIISEDNVTTNGAKVKWNIGSSVNTIPNTIDSIKKWPYIIPFGINGNLDTIPFAFYKQSSSNMGYLTVATYGTPPDNQPWPNSPSPSVTNLNALDPIYNTPDNRDWTVDRFWYIGADNPLNGSCGVVLSYNGGLINQSINELPISDNNPDSLLSQYWDSQNSTWQLPQRGRGIGSLTSSQIQTGVSAVIDTAFNIWNTHWTLTSIKSPLYSSSLPVELVDFNGKIMDGKVKLCWKTLSEINNDYFEVYKSYNGINFNYLNKVFGNGNSNVPIDYYYFDNVDKSTYLYYKLIQVDFDGNHKEYGPIVIKNEKNLFNLVKIVNILGQEVDESYDGYKIYYK